MKLNPLQPLTSTLAGQSERPFSKVSTVRNGCLKWLSEMMLTTLALGVDNTDRILPEMEYPGIRPWRYSQMIRGQKILSQAFPCLFPCGKADWALPLLRAV